MSDKKAWIGKTGGTRWMQQSLIGMFRHIDTRWLYPMMVLWILGYILFAPSGRRGIYYYWRHRQGKSPMAACWNLWCNYLEFGKVILDRFAAYSGQHVSIRKDGADIMDFYQRQPGGFIVISSHIGHQELAGYSFSSLKPMHVLSFMGDTETVNSNRKAMFEAMGLHLLPLQADGGHVLEMHNVVQAGEVLSIHGDRMFFGDRSISCSLLGELAPYPEGPYRVAVAEGVPVLTMFMMREGHKKYTLYIRQLSDGTYMTTGRKAQSEELLQRFVQTTEEILQRYPHQWFHFYQFWKHKEH